MPKKLEDLADRREGQTRTGRIVARRDGSQVPYRSELAIPEDLVQILQGVVWENTESYCIRAGNPFLDTVFWRC